MDWKHVGRVALVVAALPLSGCATMFGGYDLAPSGLPRAEDALRRDLARQPARAYDHLLEGADDLPTDDLLRLLFAGTAGRYAGAHYESGHLLDLATYLAEDRVTLRVSQQALSMVSSDRALDYTPGPNELLMIHYVAAAGYLEAGDLGAAAVEARRLEARLDRLADRGTAVPGRAFLHTLAATIFEAAGDATSAEVAYRRARAAGGAEAPAAAALDAPTDTALFTRPTGEVVVLVETGTVPHRVEQSVVLMVPAWQAKRLTDGDAGDKATAALEAATRVLLSADGGHRRGYYRGHGYPGAVHLAPWDDGKGSDGDPYLLRISWPVLYQAGAEAAPVRVRAGDRVAPATALLDIAEGARRDFDAERPTLIARTLARAVSKMALTSAARDAAEEKDEVLGDVVGWLANLGTALAERADTRCWHLLPGSVSLVRLELPAGSHDLVLEAGGRSIPLGPVDVAPGRIAFRTHRVWN